MPQLMTQAEFAARHKVGKPAVTAWKKRNLLVFAPDPERPGKQLVDAERSDILVRGVIDQTRGRPRGGDQVAAEAAPAAAPAAPRMSEAESVRVEEARERIRSRRIDNERALGGLVSLAEFERRASDLGRRAREGVQSVHRQLAERLAAETDPRAIAALLSDGVDQVFTRLADEIEAEASQEREVDRQLAPLAADEEPDEELEAV